MDVSMQISMEMQIGLPEWVRAYLLERSWPLRLRTLEERMELAIDLSALNIQYGTGGPFGAVVIEEESGLVIAVGVNRVVALHCFALHAEMVAVAMAQHALQTFNLGEPGRPPYQLVTSAQPCSMCGGGVPWMGVHSVAIGAPSDQVEALTRRGDDEPGFDEGPLHPNWRNEWGRRGIKVIEGILVEEACRVLARYGENGIIYNATRPHETKPT